MISLLHDQKLIIIHNQVDDLMLKLVSLNIIKRF